MKKFTLLKHLSILIIYSLTSFLSFAQTTLSAGDIVITGFTSDDPDQFSFVLLTDIEANTTINFTDNGWFQTGGFRNNEGTITWTANTDLYCGTEIKIAFIGSNTYSSTKGSAVETNLGFALATLLGDQILAYQGTDESPTFIYAINFSNAGWSDATTANSTAIPIGLTNGVNAVSLVQIDNATYNCSVTSNTPQILEAVSTTSNWTLSTDRISIGGCYYSCVICTGGTVTWDGTWSENPDITTQVIISSDYNTGNETSFNACSLKIENGANLTIANNTYVTVENDLMVDANSSINVEHSGAFVQKKNSSNITNEGEIMVNKTTAFAENWYEYTYWSSPVLDATIANGLTDSQVGRRFVFNAQNYLDETKEVGNNNNTRNGQDDIDDNGNDWQSVSDSAIMQPGVGYASFHNKSIFESSGLNQFNYTFEGPFNNGNITVPVYRNDSELRDNNWNLIGNPYPSAIDADEFLNENTYSPTNTNGTLDGVIFLWSQNSPPSNTANGNQAYNFTNADYAIINGTGEIAGGDGVTPTRNIPSCQGFFVSMSNNTSAALVSGNVYASNVVFNNNMRVSGTSDNSQFFKSEKEDINKSKNNHKLWLNLTSENVFNQTLIGYLNAATDADDGAYFDTPKHASASISPIIYSIIEGAAKKFGIQGKALSSLSKKEVIKLGFSTPLNTKTSYKISIAKLEGDFFNKTSIYLKDHYLETINNISNSDYTFTSESGEFNNRFDIVFRDKAESNHKITADALKIIDKHEQHVEFKVPEHLSIVRIEIYNLLGNQLYIFEGQNATEICNLPHLNHTIYVAKVALSNGQILTKKAIKK